MPRFFFAYRGGSQPATPEEGQAMMARWRQWIADMGDRLVEPQNPFGPTVTVSASGTAEGGANPYSGYSLVEASDIEEVKAIAASCPFLEMDNAFIEIAEIRQM